MKRRIILSIALALSIVLVSLMSSDSSVAAQNQIKIVADTGMVALGPGQTLRLTVAAPVGVVNLDHHILEFRRINYTENVCSGNVCKQSVASVTNSGAIALLPGEAASFHIGPEIYGNGVRGVVLSNSRDLRVNAMIIETATGKIVSLYDPASGFFF
jgi:hypothetical protein